jgi:hypothetical protein
MRFERLRKSENLKSLKRASDERNRPTKDVLPGKAKSRLQLIVSAKLSEVFVPHTTISRQMSESFRPQLLGISTRIENQGGGCSSRNMQENSLVCRD